MSDQPFIQAMLDQLQAQLGTEGASPSLVSMLEAVDPLVLDRMTLEWDAQGQPTALQIGSTLQIGSAIDAASALSRPNATAAPPSLRLRRVRIDGLSRQAVTSLRAGGRHGRTISVKTRLCGEIVIFARLELAPPHGGGSDALALGQLELLALPEGEEPEIELILEISELQRGVLVLAATEIRLQLAPESLQLKVDLENRKAVWASQVVAAIESETTAAAVVEAIRRRLVRPEALQALGERVTEEVDAYLKSSLRYPYNVPAAELF